MTNKDTYETLTRDDNTIKNNMGLHETDITVVYEKLPCTIKGVAIKSKNTIVLNSNIEKEQQQDAYIKMLSDIKNDTK